MTNVAPGVKYPPKPPKPALPSGKMGKPVTKLGGKRGGPVVTKKGKKPDMRIA